MILTIKSVLKKQMLKELMLVFSLMLFMIATYYVIQFAHGISNFLNESMTLRSDAHEFLFQPDTALLDANPDYPTTMVPIPYSMGLFIHEIESMHIQVKLSS